MKTNRRILLALIAALMTMLLTVQATAVGSKNAVVEVTTSPAVMPQKPVSAVSGTSGTNEEGESEVTGLTMTDAINRAKEIFGDTQDYETFDSYYENRDGYTLYNFNWNDSKERDGFQITIGSDGVLYTYSSFMSYTSTYFTIPGISKKEAVGLAYAFVLKTNPQFADCLSAEHASVRYSYGTYTVTFDRFAGDTQVKDNNLSVSILHDGTILSLSAYAMATRVQPLGEGAAPDAAKSVILDSFREALPFSLVYYVIPAENKEDHASIGLHYVPNNDLTRYAIDAATGEAYPIEYKYSGGMRNAAYKSADMVMTEEAAVAAPAAGYQLSEAEQKAVELQDSFISLKEAVAIIDSLVGLKPSVTVSNYSLSESESLYTGAKTYLYRINLADEGKNGVGYATLNAETGEVKSCSLYDRDADYKKATEHKYTEEESLKAGEAFLKTAYPDKFTEYRLAEDSAYFAVKAADYSCNNYSFSYKRYVNDIVFPTDTMSVRVNPDTLEIISFGCSYSADAAFPAPTDIITADEAAAVYFRKTNPEPVYLVSLGMKDDKLILSGSGNYADEKTLVRAYTFQEYCFVDAFTGLAVDYSNKPYTPSAKTAYFTDAVSKAVAGSPYSEAILKLFDMDIISSLKSYSPSSAITYGEFTAMIRTLERYHYSAGRTAEEETAPESKISREEAARLLVKQIGYGDIARYESIFKCAFSDAADISEGYTGFVAIASALGFLDCFGDTLAPAELLTQGEAAQIVYDYLLQLNAEQAE